MLGPGNILWDWSRLKWFIMTPLVAFTFFMASFWPCHSGRLDLDYSSDFFKLSKKSWHSWNLPFCPKAGRKKFFEWLGPGTNTKHKFKGEASGQSVILNQVYTHTPLHNPQTFSTLPGTEEASFCEVKNFFNQKYVWGIFCAQKKLCSIFLWHNYLNIVGQKGFKAFELQIKTMTV